MQLTNFMVKNNSNSLSEAQVWVTKMAPIKKELINNYVLK